MPGQKSESTVARTTWPKSSVRAAARLLRKSGSRSGFIDLSLVRRGYAAAHNERDATTPHPLGQSACPLIEAPGPGAPRSFTKASASAVIAQRGKVVRRA